MWLYDMIFVGVQSLGRSQQLSAIWVHLVRLSSGSSRSDYSDAKVVSEFTFIF